MEILENVATKKKDKDKPDIILMISYKEAKVFAMAIQEYSNNNKRLVIAKGLHKQMYTDLPY